MIHVREKTKTKVEVCLRTSQVALSRYRITLATGVDFDSLKQILQEFVGLGKAEELVTNNGNYYRWVKNTKK